MNFVELEGRVVWEPRVNKTGAGKVVTNFVLDVPTGRGKKKTNVRCVAWDDVLGSVEIAQGDNVYGKGRIESRSYEKDGRKVELTEVILESVQKRPKASHPVQQEAEIPF